MAYKEKTYVCYDKKNDLDKYKEMCKWEQDNGTHFKFYDSYDIKNMWDLTNTNTTKKRLKVLMNDSKILVVLVGEKTNELNKFIQWEIEVALDLELPIVIVNLNGEREVCDDLLPTELRGKLNISIAYEPKIMQHALENWTEEERLFIKAQKLNGKGKARVIIPHFYSDDIYEKFEEKKKWY